MKKFKETRLGSRLNKFWKRVRNFCTIISGALGVVMASQHFDIVKPDEVLYTIIKYTFIITLTIAATAQFTKE